VIATPPLGGPVAPLYRVAIAVDYAPGRFRVAEVGSALMPYHEAMQLAGKLNRKARKNDERDARP